MRAFLPSRLFLLAQSKQLTPFHLHARPQVQGHEGVADVQDVVLPLPRALWRAANGRPGPSAGHPCLAHARRARGGVHDGKLDRASSFPSFLAPQGPLADNALYSRLQVRIYKVKDLDSLGRKHKAVGAFESGTRLKKSVSTGPSPKGKRRTAA